MRDFTCMVLNRTAVTKALRSLALLFSLSIFGVANAQTFNFLNLTYKVTSTTNPSVEVVQGGNRNNGAVVVPDKVDYNDTTWTVTGIGYAAFAEQSGMTSISMPSTIEYIGNSAFYGDFGLSSITIPENVDSIGVEAFISCLGIPSINIPSKVRFIGDGAFSGCQNLSKIDVDASNQTFSSEDGVLFNKDKTTLVTYPQARRGSYVIPSTVKTVGNYAFRSAAITGVEIPEGVETLGTGAFLSSRIQSVTIPSTVKGALNATFSFCSSLTSVTINSNQITTIGTQAFYPDGNLASINIPSSVTTIGRSAFADCSSLSSLQIPDNVDSIGDLAFEGCRSLSTLAIPTSVRTIGEQAFSQCPFTEFTIPEGVVSLGTRAFEGCYNLRTVNFPSTLTNIGANLFGYDNALASINIAEGNPSYLSREGIIYTSDLTKLVMTPPAYQGKIITVPEGVKVIEASAVSGCQNVTEVSLPQSLDTISRLAFYQDYNLKKINIPEKVTFIGMSAFNSTGLDTVYCYVKTPISIDDYTFSGVGAFNEGKVLYVPRASIDDYKNNFYWGQWHEILPIEDVTNGITGIKADDTTSAGRYFNLSGEEVPADTKGILIHNGKKVLVK